MVLSVGHTTQKKSEGDRKGLHPSTQTALALTMNAPYLFVAFVRAGVAGMRGGDPCGRPRSRNGSCPPGNLACRRQAGFLTLTKARELAGAQFLLVLAV